MVQHVAFLHLQMGIVCVTGLIAEVLLFSFSFVILHNGLNIAESEL